MTFVVSLLPVCAPVLQWHHRAGVLKGVLLVAGESMSSELMTETLIEKVRRHNYAVLRTTYGHSIVAWKSVTTGCLESFALHLLVPDLVHLVCNSTVDLVVLVLVVAVGLEVGMVEIPSAYL